MSAGTTRRNTSCLLFNWAILGMSYCCQEWKDIGVKAWRQNCLQDEPWMQHPSSFAATGFGKKEMCMWDCDAIFTALPSDRSVAYFGSLRGNNTTTTHADTRREPKHASPQVAWHWFSLGTPRDRQVITQRLQHASGALGDRMAMSQVISKCNYVLRLIYQEE